MSLPANAMPVAVGVDLGSTHCNVGVWHQSRPEVIANHHGLRATPTMVAFTESEVLVGEAALSQMPKNVANTITGFKWMVGQNHAQLEPHIKAMLGEWSMRREQTVSKPSFRNSLGLENRTKMLGDQELASHTAACGGNDVGSVSAPQQLRDPTHALSRNVPVPRLVLVLPTCCLAVDVGAGASWSD